MTWTTIINKINTKIIDNIIKFITPAFLREILLDMSGMHGAIHRFLVITVVPIDLSTISNGSTISDRVVSTDDVFLAMGQADPTEKGFYIVGLNPGDTVRHSDYPDLASCADVVCISTYPDEYGNSFVTTKLDNLGNLIYSSNSPIAFNRGVGSFTQAFPAKTMLKEIIIIKTSALKPSIIIGTTPGGSEILNTTEIEGVLPLVNLNEYFPGAGDIYYTVTGTSSTLFIRFEHQDYSALQTV